MQGLTQSKVTPQSQMVHGVENVQYREKKTQSIAFELFSFLLPFGFYHSFKTKNLLVVSTLKKIHVDKKKDLRF